jgi:peptidoglycan/xylan/chitin deacetylase (PgdA/CDA1 family)
MYHEVAEAAPAGFGKYVVAPRAFAAHMRWLRLAGYRTVTMDALLAHRDDTGRLPARPVIVTFDDGYRGCVRHAGPTLARHGFTAVVFVVAGLVGSTARWLAARGLDLPLADWDELRAARQLGVRYGSHGLTHERLVALGEPECRRQLSDARHRLEDGLGEAIVHLAYPFGAYDERVKALAREVGYRSACSVRAGLSRDGDDRLALRRVPVDGGGSLLDFACRVATGHPVRDVLAHLRRPRWRRREAAV